MERKTPTEDGSTGQRDDESRTYLTFEKHGSTVVIGAVVDGEEVFYANPDAKRCWPVIKGALRTFGRRAWPELTSEDVADENGGGAFQ